jgi:anaerobic ribonucleoside-triphosphate reductase
VAPNAQVTKQPQQRHRHTGKEWEDKKQTIIQLYINEGKSSEAVIKILQDDFTIGSHYKELCSPRHIAN